MKMAIYIIVLALFGVLATVTVDITVIAAIFDQMIRKISESEE
jgi:hypothetical protein